MGSEKVRGSEGSRRWRRWLVWAIALVRGAEETIKQMEIAKERRRRRSPTRYDRRRTTVTDAVTDRDADGFSQHLGLDGRPNPIGGIAPSRARGCTLTSGGCSAWGSELDVRARRG